MIAKTLVSILKRIGEYDIDFFKDRLLLQKHVYFLQSFGVYLGYRFSWYLHGPYSPQLTRDCFDGATSGTVPHDVAFTASGEENFSCFLRFLGDKKKDAVWMEILASLHFLTKAYPRRNKTEIFGIVMRKQPYLNDKNKCEEAWSYLKRFGSI